MLRKTLAIIIAVIIIVAAVSAVAYTQFIAPSGNARSIKIGVVAPMSTSIGQDMWAAAQLAAKEINDAGGVYISEWRTNVNITLVQVDTVKDADTTIANAAVSQAITVDGVDLLIGGYGSTATLSDSKIAIEQKVPFIVTGASTPLITERGPQANYGGLAADDNRRVTDEEGMSYIFHYCTTTNDYSKTVVDFFANEMRPLLQSTYSLDSSRQFRLAILYKNDAFGQGVVQSVNYWIQNESLPITIVDSLSVAAGTTDFTTPLLDIKSAKPDAVFVVNDPAYTPSMITQGQDQGLNTVYIAVENNEDPAFYSGLGSSGNNQLLESKFAPNVSPSYSSLVDDYVQDFKATYPNLGAPGMMGADTYDAVYIAKAAIESAGTVTKANVKTAIENINIDNILILTQTSKIQFSTGLNYHEIAPTTFIQQLKWNATTSSFTTTIVYCTTSTAINSSAFVLPDGYQPGI